MNKLILTIPILIMIFITGCSEAVEITNFEECIAAGNPAMESYPRQCRANDITFVEEIDTIPTTDSDDVGPLATYFFDEIIEKGVEKMGQPIGGFDAYLLKRAFPGLVDEDFNNVEALLGVYKFDNELRFEQNPTGPIHSAAQTVSKKGMEKLMGNAAGRLNVELINQESVDKLIGLLE